MKTAKRIFLNPEQTHFKQRIKKGEENCSKIVISPSGIQEHICYSFDKQGKVTSHSEGHSNEKFDLSKLKVSPQLQPYTKKEGDKVVINMPEGKYFKLESVEYTQGLNWTQLGTLEVSKDPKNVAMWRQAEPTELIVVAQKKPILGSPLERWEEKRAKRSKVR